MSKIIKDFWKIKNKDKVYKIIYDLNNSDAVLPKNTKYSFTNKESFKLPILENTQYKFIGWINKEDNSVINFVEKETNKNLNLLAKFKIPKLSIMTSGPNFQKIINPIKTAITSIEFVDTIPNLDNIAQKYDISENQDNSIIAWVDDTKLYISNDGIVIANTNCRNLFAYFPKCSSIKFNNLFDTSNVITMQSMFSETGEQSTSVIDLDLSNFITSKVLNMSDMFNSFGLKATSIILNLSNWDVSNVTKMNSMFSNTGYESSSFEIKGLSNWNILEVTDMSFMFSYAGQSAIVWSIGDLTNWNTPKVANMSAMFSGAGKSSSTWSIGDLSNWNTSNVVYMNEMFHGAGKSSAIWTVGDLSNWDVSKVTNMGHMFNEAGYEATQWFVGSLFNWDTSSVTNMKNMFSRAADNAESLELDLSSWDVSKVTSFEEMFYGSGDANKHWSVGDLSSWDTSKATTLKRMFSNVLDIKGGITIRNSESNVEYMFDWCRSDTGGTFYVNYIDDATMMKAQEAVATNSEGANVVLGTDVDGLETYSITYNLMGGNSLKEQ